MSGRKKNILTRETLSAYNQANILTLIDVVSQGVGALVNIPLADGSRSHRLERGDIIRAKETIENLSAPVTYGDVIRVINRMDGA
jgi:isopentenyl phosphate kinase